MGNLYLCIDLQKTNCESHSGCKMAQTRRLLRITGDRHKSSIIHHKTIETRICHYVVVR